MKTTDTRQLVVGDELLRLLWSDESRPSKDWLRVQSRKYLKNSKTGIPCAKPMRDFFYNVDEVKKRLGLNGGGK